MAEYIAGQSSRAEQDRETGQIIGIKKTGQNSWT